MEYKRIERVKTAKRSKDLLKAKPTEEIDKKTLQEDQEAKKIEISQIAKMLIFGSVEDAKCIYHRNGKCRNHREGKCDKHIDEIKKDREGKGEEKAGDARIDNNFKDNHADTEIVKKMSKM